MATLTIADLDNSKRDLETVEAVANSRAASVTTRHGQQTTTLYEAIRRIGERGDAVLSNLGYFVPVDYAPGLSVTEPNFTVVGPDGKIYAAQAGALPFTTGAWNPEQWYPIQNDLNDHKLLVFDSLAEAQAAAATLPDGQVLIVTSDSSHGGLASRYLANGGSLNFDGPVDLSLTPGTLTPAPEWAEVPELDGSSAGQKTINNAVSLSLAKRTNLLKKAGAGSSVLADVKSDGISDDTASFAAAVEKGIRVSDGTTLLNAAYTGNGDIQGRGTSTVLRAAPGATSVLQLGSTTFAGGWAPRRVSNLRIQGSGKTSDGIRLSAATQPQLSGRWTIENVTISESIRGLVKLNGNIANRLRDFSLSGNDYGYYAEGSTSPLMHAGCDVLSSGEINSSAKAAVYIDSPQIGTGGTALRDMIIEFNPGFGVFVENWADSFTPLLFDNVWFEQNAKSAQVEIKGVSYAPKDLRLKNTALAVFQNGGVPMKTELINSRLIIKGSTFPDGSQMHYSVDATSVIRAEDVLMDGGVHPITVTSLVGARRTLGSFTQSHYAPPRIPLSSGVALPAKLRSQSFATAGPFSFMGTLSVSGTSANDGQVFDKCCELVVPAGATLLHTGGTITGGKWYVSTLDARWASNSATGLTLGVQNQTLLAGGWDRLLGHSWKTMAAIGRCADGVMGDVRLYIKNDTGSPATLRFSAFQIAEFSTEQEAVDFYNSRVFMN